MSEPLDTASAPVAFDSAPPSPITGYKLTREHARAGGKARQAQRRAQYAEARKSALDRLAEKLEAEADTILATYMAAIRDGDWRAAEALYDRVYGKATQRQEIEDVTEREELDDTARERHARIRDELKRRNAA